MILYCAEEIFNFNSLEVDSPSHHWVLDLQMNDYRLAKIEILEEIQCSVLRIETPLGVINIPTDWYVMIGDDDFEYDLVKLSEAVGRGFRLATNGKSAYSRLDIMPLNVVDYNVLEVVHIPMIKKSEMLCVAINDDKWIHVSPNISAKYLKSFEFYDL